MTWLSLESAGIDDAPLTQLPDLPGLRELTLSGCRKITGKGLQNLERLPHLSRLMLDYCKKVRDFAVLSALPHLRRLSLAEVPLSNKAAATFPELPGLTHLNLTRSALRPRGFEALARFPNLEQLLYCPAPNAEPLGPELEVLAHLPRLRTLILPHATVSLAPLARVPQLTTLRIPASSLATTPELSALSSLRRLYLSDPDDAAVEAALALPHLSQLSLYRTSPERMLSSSLIERLRAVPSLRVELAGSWGDEQWTDGWAGYRAESTPGDRGGQPWLEESTHSAPLQGA